MSKNAHRYHVAPASSINSSGDKLTDRGIEQLQAEDRQNRLESDAKDPLRQAIERQLTGVTADKAAQDQPDQQRDVRSEAKPSTAKLTILTACWIVITTEWVLTNWWRP